MLRSGGVFASIVGVIQSTDAQVYDISLEGDDKDTLSGGSEIVQ